MNIKQLKEELSKFPDNMEVYVTSDDFLAFSIPIKEVKEGYTTDASIVLLML